MRVVGYCRVSTDGQAAEGVSLDAQRAKVEQFAGLHELDLVAVLVDAGESAKTLDRPGLAATLGLLDRGLAAGLVVYKLDRLTRSLGDWTHLIERYFGARGGFSLMSVCESIDTRTAAGRMVLNIMMTVAQWEREAIVERTNAAVSHKRSKGERLGQIPFGKRLADDGRTLQDDPADREALSLIRTLRCEGYSHRAIAALLEMRGYRTKSGRPWRHSTVGGLLRKKGGGDGGEGEAA